MERMGKGEEEELRKLDWLECNIASGKILWENPFER
jgi:hypothetical protein